MSTQLASSTPEQLLLWLDAPAELELLSAQAKGFAAERVGFTPQEFWVLRLAAPLHHRENIWRYGICATRLQGNRFLQPPILGARAAILLIDDEQAGPERIQTFSPSPEQKPWIIATLWEDTSRAHRRCALRAKALPLKRNALWLAPLVSAPIFAVFAAYALSHGLADSGKVLSSIITAIIVGFFGNGVRLFTRGAWYTWGVLAIYGIGLITLAPFIVVLVAAGVLMLLLSLVLRLFFAGAALRLWRQAQF